MVLLFLCFLVVITLLFTVAIVPPTKYHKFTVWGSDACPNITWGTSGKIVQVYNGTGVSSPKWSNGGTSSSLCVPKQIGTDSNLDNSVRSPFRTLISPMLYMSSTINQPTIPFLNNLYSNVIVCAVCIATDDRNVQILRNWGSYACPSGQIRLYGGMSMGTAYSTLDELGQTDQICVTDKGTTGYSSNTNSTDLFGKQRQPGTNFVYMTPVEVRLAAPNYYLYFEYSCTVCLSVADSSQPLGRGTLITQWGPNTCPVDTTAIFENAPVFSAYVGHYGATPDPLCSMTSPTLSGYENSNPTPSSRGASLIYTAGVYTTGYGISQMNGYNKWKMACSVCQRSQSFTNTIMIPGAISCPANMSMNYNGYLFAGLTTQAALAFTCFGQYSGFMFDGNTTDPFGRFYPVSASTVVNPFTTVYSQFGYGRKSSITCSSCSGSGGPIYTRWGRADCPVTANLVYAGVVATGRGRRNTAASVERNGQNYLCMWPKAEWFPSQVNQQAGYGGSAITTVQYVFGSDSFVETLYNHPTLNATALRFREPLCAVCQAKMMPGETLPVEEIMIPGTTQCPAGWRLEYKGFIVSPISNMTVNVTTFYARRPSLCMDEAPSAVNSSTGADEDGAGHWVLSEFYGVDNGGIGAYDEHTGKIVSCVVCTMLALPVCGDGVVNQGSEQCDDGNQINTDACRNDCLLPACGDGILSISEVCDDGNTINTDSCLFPTCILNACGDNFINIGVEECEVSNTNICSSSCSVKVNNALFNGTASTTSVTLMWSPPSIDNINQQIQSYIINVTSINSASTYYTFPFTTLTTTFTSLSPYITYEFKIFVVTNIASFSSHLSNPGKWSSSIFLTPYVPPPVITSVTPIPALIGGYITVAGVNFTTSTITTTFTVDGLSCLFPTFTSANVFECLLPPVSLGNRIAVATTYGVVASPDFSFAAQPSTLVSILQVHPAAVRYSTPITLFGAGFGNNISAVRVFLIYQGSGPANLQSFACPLIPGSLQGAGTIVWCRIPTEVTFGVNVYDGNYFNLTMSVDGFATPLTTPRILFARIPNVNTALPRGGIGNTLLTLIGTDFGSDLSKIVVKLGLQDCPLTATANSTYLVCTVPFLPVGESPVSLSYYSIPATVGVNTDDSLSLSFNYLSLPTVLSVSPLGGLATDSTITLSGLNFGDSMFGVRVRLYLVDTPAPIYYDCVLLSVYTDLGRDYATCTVSSTIIASETQYYVQLSRFGVFAPLPLPKYIIINPALVSSVSPRGGLAGTVLTVRGMLFGANSESQLSLSLQSPTQPNDEFGCPIRVGTLSPFGDQIECVVDTLPSAFASQQSTPWRVIVRRFDVDSIRPATAMFYNDTFLYAARPILTGVLPIGGMLGSVVTVTGSGFVPSLDPSFWTPYVEKAAVRISIGNSGCEILSISPSEIVCVLQQSDSILATIVVGLWNVYSVDSVTFQFVFSPPYIAAITPLGGLESQEITLSGSGFGVDPNSFQVFVVFPGTLVTTLLERCTIVAGSLTTSAVKVRLPAIPDTADLTRIYSNTSTLSIVVNRFNLVATLALPFAVTYIYSPIIQSIFPTGGQALDLVTLRGYYFGSSTTDIAVKMDGNPCVIVAVREATTYDGMGEVEFLGPPATIDNHIITLTRFGIPAMQSKSFEYVPKPSIIGITPVGGIVSSSSPTTITVHGERFLTLSPSTTLTAFIGTTPCVVNPGSITTTSFTCDVQANLAPASYDISVFNYMVAASVPSSLAAQFVVVQQHNITVMDPQGGIVGQTFTLQVYPTISGASLSDWSVTIMDVAMPIVDYQPLRNAITVLAGNPFGVNSPFLPGGAMSVKLIRYGYINDNSLPARSFYYGSASVILSIQPRGGLPNALVTMLAGPMLPGTVAGDVTIQIGPTPATILSLLQVSNISFTNEVVFRIPLLAPTEYLIVVNVNGVPTEGTQFTFTVIDKPIIGLIAPRGINVEPSLSDNDNITFSVTGQHFGVVAANLRATLGSLPCTINPSSLSLGGIYFTCFVNVGAIRAANIMQTNQTFTITNFGISPATTDPLVLVDFIMRPTVVSILPRGGVVLGVITITGSNFIQINSAAYTSVIITNMASNSSSLCRINDITTTVITCFLPPFLGSSFSIDVVFYQVNGFIGIKALFNISGSETATSVPLVSVVPAIPVFVSISPSFSRPDSLVTFVGSNLDVSDMDIFFGFNGAIITNDIIRQLEAMGPEATTTATATPQAIFLAGLDLYQLQNCAVYVSNLVCSIPTFAPSDLARLSVAVFGSVAENINKIEITVFKIPDIIHADQGAGLAILTLTIFCLVAIVVISGMYLKYKNVTLIRTHQVRFSLLSLFGASVFVSSTLVGLENQVDVNCSIKMWLLVLGFTMMVMPLIFRLWRIYRIVKNPKLRKVQISDISLLVRMMPLVAIDVVMLVMWNSGQPPPHVELKINTSGEVQQFCVSSSASFLGIIGLIKVLSILYACRLAIKSRNIISQFNESKNVGLTMYNLFFIGVIFGPLYIFVKNDAINSYIVISIGTILMTISTVSINFVRRLTLLYNYLHTSEDDRQNFFMTMAATRTSVQLGTIHQDEKGNLWGGRIPQLSIAPVREDDILWQADTGVAKVSNLGAVVQGKFHTRSGESDDSVHSNTDLIKTTSSLSIAKSETTPALNEKELSPINEIWGLDTAASYAHRTDI